LHQWDQAIDRFRRIVAKNPTHPVALNDLAYVLATQKKALDEALSLAKRAYSLPNAAPESIDTLGWIYHLLGQDAEAEPLIKAALSRMPLNAEVHVHAGAVLAATGNLDGAQREIEAAIGLDHTLTERADVKELRERIGTGK
jgi:Flp pilus assembly protein TadD